MYVWKFASLFKKQNLTKYSTNLFYFTFLKDIIRKICWKCKISVIDFIFRSFMHCLIELEKMITQV